MTEAVQLPIAGLPLNVGQHNLAKSCPRQSEERCNPGRRWHASTPGLADESERDI